uniref:PHD-type domain-containing protein n=1 Tax=Ananas comosus var. bracteatus TaxID=296719 RepID=A0A6V7PCJ1_ANACO|nr:unnamed protein product [Ananas comosus var. bracteatus]
MEWSKVESRCPLCKRRFVTITKSSKSDLGLGIRKPVIRVEKRDQVYQPSEEEMRGMLDPYESVVCIECQQGGDDNLMLLCDICDSPAHTYCVGLGREVPEGNWYCECCRAAGEGSSFSQAPDTVFDRGARNNNESRPASVEIDINAPQGAANTNPQRSMFDLNLSLENFPRRTRWQHHRCQLFLGGVQSNSV